MKLNKDFSIQGIYKIINISSGLFYIGSSKNIKTRLKEHFLRLRGDRHNNRHLQSTFNLYGESIFTVEVVEVCVGLTKDELLDREQYYLDGINNWRLCYNQTRSARYAGKIYLEESEKRQAVSKRTTGEANAFYGKEHTQKSLEEMAEAKRIRGSNVYLTKTGFWQVKIRLLETKSNLSLGTFKAEDIARRVKFLAEELYWYSNESVKEELEQLQKSARTLTDAAHSKGGGVNLNSDGLWAARITANGKNIRLGTYHLKEDAEKARSLAEKVYWEGELSLELELIALRKTSIQKHNFCGVGVVENKKGGYTATIYVNGSTKKLKTFPTELEAREHRIKAEKYYYENDQTFSNLFYTPKKETGLPVGVIQRGNKFRASISIEGKRKQLGTFGTPELAYQARLAAEQSLLN